MLFISLYLPFPFLFFFSLAIRCVIHMAVHSEYCATFGDRLRDLWWLCIIVSAEQVCDGGSQARRLFGVKETAAKCHVSPVRQKRRAKLKQGESPRMTSTNIAT